MWLEEAGLYDSNGQVKSQGEVGNAYLSYPYTHNGEKYISHIEFYGDHADIYYWGNSNYFAPVVCFQE